MLQHPKTWFVIADGARARILAHRVGEPTFETVTEFASVAAHRTTEELGSDKPPRAFESVGGARHAMEARSDFHEAAKAEFADMIAENINDGASRNAFDLLVLIAPPHVLQEIKEHLPAKIAERVAAKLPKDLTKLPDWALHERLRGIRIPQRVR